MTDSTNRTGFSVLGGVAFAVFLWSVGLLGIDRPPITNQRSMPVLPRIISAETDPKMYGILFHIKDENGKVCMVRCRHLYDNGYVVADSANLDEPDRLFIVRLDQMFPVVMD